MYIKLPCTKNINTKYVCSSVQEYVPRNVWLAQENMVFINKILAVKYLREKKNDREEMFTEQFSINSENV